jgi:hypothetical protein
MGEWTASEVLENSCYRLSVQQKDSFCADGYMGQQAVLIEELRPGAIPYSTLLQLLDGYDVMVPKKGGFVKWCRGRFG